MIMRKLPKIELHLHHEGAAPPSFIQQLAAEKNVDLSGIFKANGDYSFSTFNEFLSTYEAACQVLKEPEDFHRLTLSILEKSAENGVIYTEVFISPDFCGGRIQKGKSYQFSLWSFGSTSSTIVFDAVRKHMVAHGFHSLSVGLLSVFPL